MNPANYFRYLLPVALIAGFHVVTACSEERREETATRTAPPTAQAPAAKPEAPAPSDDVVARVGDQDIRFGEINTMLNSSAVVGLSLPALGTPERDTVRIALLDKMISANLMYLDALSKGLDKDPDYTGGMRRFEDVVLADLYVQRQIANDIEVSEQEVVDYYTNNIAAGTEFNDDTRAAVASVLRKQKFGARQEQLRNELREQTRITLYQNNFAPDGDADRDAAAPVADIGDEHITWGEVRERLTAAGAGAVKRDPLAMELDARQNALQNEIDTRLLAARAREAGLESDPVYARRFGEYSKTRLINLHRARMAAGLEPTDDQLRAYFEANRDSISIPEFRKVQMVMLKTEDEARSLKQRIEAGELTMYQAAADHSVAPDAKQNLGEVGWLGKGKTRPALDAVIFALQPAEIGGPVEAGGLWHLVTVLDVRDPQYENFDDPATHSYLRRKYIHDKLDQYVVALRRDRFPVEVYEDKLIRLAQQEADLVGSLAARSVDPTSVTQQRVEELRELLGH